ncbi:hypothetical protein C8R47DRAFT_1212720 [Mycena vitilis]|nr:hypothetical protein C8R47DRAFT_1212720 [Mycena vitilis]
MAKVNRNCTYAHARPTRLRPMRPHLLADRDAVDQWVAAEDLMADPDVPMHAPLADDEVRCEIYVTLLEGMYGPVYRLALAVYNPHVGKTGDLSLGRYQGIPTDKDAPLWTRRLPLFKNIRFTQPRAFVAMLVAGMSDIQFFEPASSKALLWARKAAISTPVQRLVSRHCRNVALRSVKVWARGQNLRG